jgi:4'-phosphopantetheinyl transferase EntD
MQPTAPSHFEELLPPGAVVVEARDPAWWAGGLLPQELRHVAHAADKRRREFTAGRHCARAALARLGLPEVAIGVGAQREPLFPPEVSGSITHTRDFCAAAAMRTGAVRSIGIDAEDDAPMSDEIARRLMGDEERTALQRVARLGNVDVLAFCLKEAFYKAAFPLCRRYLDFDEVAIRWSGTDCRIELRSPRLIAELEGLEIAARFRRADGRLHGAVALSESATQLYRDAPGPDTPADL